MSPGLLMVLASLLFALMGVCVKFASAQYSAGELVMYRSLMGLAVMGAVMRIRGIGWRTPVASMHLWRSASGTTALCLWFTAIGVLPLATAMTLNAMSSVWVALFLVGGSVLMLGGGNAGRPAGVDGRLVLAVLVGFAGVALVLRPTVGGQQLWHGLIGVGSGLLAAVAYLQVTALGRVGEPSERVVFYFSLSGVVLGGGLALASDTHGHTPHGVALLLAIGGLATAAQWMMTRAWGSGPTLGIAALQYLGVLFSFLFGVLLFGDPVTPAAVTGMLLIVGGGVAATLVRTTTPATRDTRETPDA